MVTRSNSLKIGSPSGADSFGLTRSWNLYTFVKKIFTDYPNQSQIVVCIVCLFFNSFLTKMNVVPYSNHHKHQPFTWRNCSSQFFCALYCTKGH